jgi:hypothetical protein
MSGTSEGGRKTRDRLTAKDPDFYRKIGAKGGKNGRRTGFFLNRELARIAGKKGGLATARKRLNKPEGG